MRVLEEHPVELTFFFVPQVVQALRVDGLGYVARFIFETSKISQLFCHQIIWNMKANTYRDDDVVSNATAGRWIALLTIFSVSGRSDETHLGSHDRDDSRWSLRKG
jgi:phosphatidylinositol 4-kinase